MQRTSRMKRELEMLEKHPPPGISAWPFEDSMTHLHARKFAILISRAEIQGPKDSPFEGGTFKLNIQIPDRYPFEPPSVRFITPIYHPNIDSSGRICLDILKMPPKGSWTPSLNVSTVLTSIQLLMDDANPDDGLMVEISDLFRRNYKQYCENAKASTAKYAIRSGKEVLEDVTNQEEKNDSLKRKEKISPRKFSLKKAKK